MAVPSYEDPLVTGASTAIGGPPGRRARPGGPRWAGPVRWLVLLTLLTSVLGFWQKSPCRTHPWTEEYQYTRACYTDVVALYYSERLDAGATPYLDHPVEYPVVMGAAMLLAASVTEEVAALPEAPRERAATFYDLTWVLLTACALVVVLTTARLAGRRRVWDAAMVAVAPALVIHATTNWDLVAVALAGLGLLAWARSRPVAAGVLLGLATATKLYPVLFLVPLLALCWRAGQLRAGVRTAVALAVTAAAATLPVYLVSPSYAEVDGRQVQVAASPLDRLGEQGLAALSPHTVGTVPGSSRAVEGVNAVYRFVELNQVRGADWDSLHYALQTARDRLDGPAGQLAGVAAGFVLDEELAAGEPPSTLNRSVAVGLVVTLALVVLLAVRAPRRPRLAQLLFLVVVGFLVTNKVFSPQYTLWLLPLAVLARPSWRPFLAWQAAEVAVLLSRFYYFVSFPLGEGDQGSEGIGAPWFIGSVLLRDLALLLLAAAVVRDVLRPEHDVVRQDGTDDPAGGVLDGAPDRAVRQPLVAA